MARRKLTKRNRSKHVGHACEGHLRGLLLHLPGVTEARLTRTLPFVTPVKSDAIVLDNTGKLRAIFVVAFWDHAGSSEKKLYRTRTEFNELVRERSRQPDLFAKNFQIVTVLYGSDSGWKKQVLRDVLAECAPALFLPAVLGPGPADAMVRDIFTGYAEHWEAGRPNARQYVETSVAGRSLDATERKLLKALAGCLTGSRPTKKTVTLVRSTVRLPPRPVRTRYRQAFGVLSLFPNVEIDQWISHRSPLVNAFTERFVRRAVFLDMGRLLVTPSIAGRTIINFVPRSAHDASGNYEPHRPDFTSWEQCKREDIHWILNAHRDKASHSSQVFAGGALDQCFGNYEDICLTIATAGKSLLKAINNGDLMAATEVLAGGAPVGSENWQPCAGRAVFYPLWGFAVSALAIAVSDRGIRSEYDARRQSSPERRTAEKLARRLAASALAQKVLHEAIAFAGLLPAAPLDTVARLEQPRLLQLDEPCSWVADAYMTLASNASHNPLNEVLLRWLAQRFNTHDFIGWPASRSVAFSAVSRRATSRRQWCVIGVKGKGVIAAESKAVTSNNWGNKSKELYDRVSELRKAASQVDVQAKSVLLFDGDLTSEIMAELATGIGHDEVWTVDEVLALLRDSQD
jgi:hypothetical protein